MRRVKHLPKRALDSKGQPKRPPPRLRAHFVCAVCGTALVRAQHFWVCPAGLDHGKAQTDGVLLAEIEAAMAGHYRRWTARGILRLQLRVQGIVGLLLPRREREREKGSL